MLRPRRYLAAASFGPKKPCIEWASCWRNLANTIHERRRCGFIQNYFGYFSALLSMAQFDRRKFIASSVHLRLQHVSRDAEHRMLRKLSLLFSDAKDQFKADGIICVFTIPPSRPSILCPIVTLTRPLFCPSQIAESAHPFFHGARWTFDAEPPSG